MKLLAVLAIAADEPLGSAITSEMTFGVVRKYLSESEKLFDGL